MRTQFRESHFQIWKQRIENHIGIKLDELPDETYRIWFEESSLSPYEASKIIYRHNFESMYVT